MGIDFYVNKAQYFADWMINMDSFFKDILQKFKQGNGLNLVVKNTFWIFSDKIFKGVIGLIVGALIARYLGPARYGTLNYAISFISLIYVFGNLGLDNIVIREIVRDPKRKDLFLGTAFNLNLLGSCFVFLISLLLIYLVKPHDKLMITLVVIIALGYTFQAFNVIDLWFQSQLQAKYTAISSGIVVFLFFLAKIILIASRGSFITLAVILALEAAFSGIGLLVIYKLIGFTLKSWRFSSKVAVALLKDSWPLILSGLAVMVYMRIDQIMIGNMIGEKELGIYSAAVRISEIWYFIPMALSIYLIISTR